MAPNAERTTQPLSLSLTLHLEPPLEGDPRVLVDAIAARFDAGAPSGPASTHRTEGPHDYVSLTWPWRPPAHLADHDLAMHLDGLALAAVKAAAEWDITAVVTGLEALTMAEVDRRIREHPGPPDVVGIDECREILGQPGEPISRARFYELAKREEFPTPMRRGVYFRAAMVRYAAERHGQAPAGVAE